MEVSCQIFEFQMRLQNYFHPHFLLLLRTQLVFPAHLFLVASKRVWENWQAGGNPLFVYLFFKYSCKLYFSNLGLNRLFGFLFVFIGKLILCYSASSGLTFLEYVNSQFKKDFGSDQILNQDSFLFQPQETTIKSY